MGAHSNSRLSKSGRHDFPFLVSRKKYATPKKKQQAEEGKALLVGLWDLPFVVAVGVAARWGFEYQVLLVLVCFCCFFVFLSSVRVSAKQRRARLGGGT
jgi:hypothetical protein